MIRALVDFALNNRFIVLAMGVLLLVWGAISFHNLPVEATALIACSTVLPRSRPRTEYFNEYFQIVAVNLSPGTETDFPMRRRVLKHKTSLLRDWFSHPLVSPLGEGEIARRLPLRRHQRIVALVASLLVLLLAIGSRASGQTPVPVAMRVTLDQAIELALQHNHALLAARTTIQQNQAAETTANLRPNPSLFADWDYLPAFSPSAQTNSYLQNSTEADLGLNYLIERGNKRQHRLQAAKDATAATTSQVADNERTLAFQVASQFINVQLAESTLDLAQDNLKSYQNTIDITEIRYRSGAISQDEYLKVKLQLLQFQSDVAQAQLAKLQALSDLRALLGFEAVPANYDVAGPFNYEPLNLTLEDLQMKALQNRPDLRAAKQGLRAAQSQYELQRSIGKQDVTVQANYTHVNGINGASFYASIPLPIFNRNQGEIARTRYAITQAQESEKAAGEHVMSDVYDAYWNLRTNDQVVQLYQSGYLTEAQADRDIAEYSYQRGAASLIDFLDAERSYRTTQRAYRQVLASYLVALEQLREAIGTRSLL